MAIQIKLKNSVVQDSTPSTSDLPAVGEIALNANINSIGGFMRASDNSIVKIFGPGSLSTPTATTTVAGISELATNTETTTGSATNRVVTPAGLNAVTTAERTTSNSTYLALAGGTLTGVVAATAGSNSAPSIHFGDSDSGIFGGTNTVSLTAGGTTRLTADTGVSVVGTLAVTGAITSTDDLTIPDKIIHSGDTNTAVRFPAADTVSVETGGNEAFRVDGGQRFLHGASSSIGLNRKIQQSGTDASAGLSLNRFSADNGGAGVDFIKSRNATIGNNTIAQNNDNLGIINFRASDGSDLLSIAAQIKSQVDGTPGADDMPGRLVFATTADGGNSPTERLRITNNGRISIGNAGNNASAAALLQVKADDGEAADLYVGQFVNLEATAGQSYGVNIQAGSNSTDHGFRVKNRANDATHFLVRGDGNVGIGTSSPSTPLDVVGTGIVRVRSATADNADKQAFFTTGHYDTAEEDVLGLRIVGGNADNVVDIGGGSGQSSFNAATKIRFFTSANDTTLTGSERMRIDPNGNVGIGTTSNYDDSVLEVRKASDGDGVAIRVTNNTTTNGSQAGIIFTNSTSDFTSAAIAHKRNDNALIFYNGQSAGGGGFANATERMRIDSNGKVGIGTTNPSRKLNVNSGTDNVVALFESTDAEAQVRIKDNDSNEGIIGVTAGAFAFENTTTGSLVKILADGKVGIGTTSPSAKLEISARGDTEKGILLKDSNAAEEAPYIEVIGNRSDANSSQCFSGKLHLARNRSDQKVTVNTMLGAVAFGGNHTDGSESNILYTASISAIAADSFDSSTDMPTDLIFMTGSTGRSPTDVNVSTGTERLRINSNGILFSPFTYSNTTSNSANMAIPNSDGQMYRSTSSRKYKTNITTLTDTLADKILSCNPVSYTSLCTSDDKTKVHYGFIAEEVHEIDTSLVFYDNEAETPEPEGVQYDRFIPALVNLVKRQKTQIQTLETKVAALEAA